MRGLRNGTEMSLITVLATRSPMVSWWGCRPAGILDCYCHWVVVDRIGKCAHNKDIRNFSIQMGGSAINSWQVQFHYSRFTPPSLRNVTSGLRPSSPLTCAVGHEATFAVNVKLVASQWQHCFCGRILQGSSSNMPLSWQSGEMRDSQLDAQLFMNIIF